DLNSLSERVATWSMDQRLSTKLMTGWAIQRPDHRRLYFNYEGPVSKNRGSVKRICEGQFEIMECDQEKLYLEITFNTFDLNNGPQRGRLKLKKENSIENRNELNSWAEFEEYPEFWKWNWDPLDLYN
ncbi:MAG: hypothetical protein RJA81_669, partial [Planctomycetota bacterium]